jgi:hypothetical protein
MAEKTGAQSVAIIYDKQLALNYPTSVTYDTYRAMRIQPTLALARALTVAPIVAGKWSTFADEDVDEEVVKFIEDELFGMRSQIMEQALLYGRIDFGWQPWEKVFEMDADGRIHLKKLKPLLHDITDILVDAATGAFAGFQQRSGMTVLELERSLLISWEVEGTNWYGRPLMENARATHTAWDGANTSATRYDNKVAGAHWIVHYPAGRTTVDGVSTDNFTIASNILQALEGTGSVAIPRTPVEYVEELKADTMGWEIELLSDSSPKQSSIIDRQDYLDKNFVRALLWPERALLEGQYGTKAEASVHAGAALTNMELTDAHITRHINWYVVDQLLALNFGQGMRGKVKLESAPILDERQVFLRELFKDVIKDPAGFADIAERLDIEALFDRLDVPKLDLPEESIEDYKEQLTDITRRMVG